jgi:hypothetical protein
LDPLSCVFVAFVCFVFVRVSRQKIVLIDAFARSMNRDGSRPRYRMPATVTASPAIAPAAIGSGTGRASRSDMYIITTMRR